MYLPGGDFLQVKHGPQQSFLHVLQGLFFEKFKAFELEDLELFFLFTGEYCSRTCFLGDLRMGPGTQSNFLFCFRGVRRTQANDSGSLNFTPASKHLNDGGLTYKILLCTFVVTLIADWVQVVFESQICQVGLDGSLHHCYLLFGDSGFLRDDWTG